MKFNNSIKIGAFALFAVVLAGCSDEKMPEVNETNCQHGNVVKIQDKAMQQEFAAKCLRRDTSKAGEFKKSPEKQW